MTCSKNAGNPFRGEYACTFLCGMKASNAISPGGAIFESYISCAFPENDSDGGGTLNSDGPDSGVAVRVDRSGAVPPTCGEYGGSDRGYDRRSLDRRVPLDLGTHCICFEWHRYMSVSAGIPGLQAGWHTLQGLSLSQLSFAVAHASHASIARSFVRRVEVLPSASSFSWTAWCRCKTSLVVVS